MLISMWYPIVYHPLNAKFASHFTHVKLLLLIVSVIFKKIKYDLLDFEYPTESEYLELESISSEEKYIYIAKIENHKKQIKIGRSHNSDIKLRDMSVSRIHALITVTENGCVMEDNGSKFGTLLMMHGNYQEIHINNDLTLQIGRTVLTISLQSDCSLYF